MMMDGAPVVYYPVISTSAKRQRFSFRYSINVGAGMRLKVKPPNSSISTCTIVNQSFFKFDYYSLYFHLTFNIKVKLAIENDVGYQGY